MSRWSVRYDGYDPSAEPLREALCTLANGYVGTRAAAPESMADGTHYPGNYVGGLYDRQSTDVDGHTVENEDLVNVPNWLPLTFRIDDDTEWFGDGCTEFLLHHQELDMRRGVLTRQVRLRDAHGRVSRVTQRRFVSMHDPHALALETTIVAENWSGRLAIRSGLDGRVTNACVARYHDLERRHLSHPITGQGEDSVWLSATTSGSGVDVVLAARTRVVDRQGVLPGAVDVHARQLRTAWRRSSRRVLAGARITNMFRYRRTPAAQSPLAATGRGIKRGAKCR